jgi:hypothetical protein
MPYGLKCQSDMSVKGSCVTGTRFIYIYVYYLQSLVINEFPKWPTSLHSSQARQKSNSKFLVKTGQKIQNLHLWSVWVSWNYEKVCGSYSRLEQVRHELAFIIKLSYNNSMQLRRELLVAQNIVPTGTYKFWNREFFKMIFNFYPFLTGYL